MKLQHKTLLMISSVILLVVIVISFAISYNNRVTMETQMGNAAHDMAISVANMPNLPKLLEEKDKSGQVQEIIQPIMEMSRYQYIIVMDLEGIQYSYPYESGLYKPYKNGGEDQVLTRGIGSVSADSNKLISAIRAFEPIYYQGDQVGAVLVGLLTDTIQAENNRYIQQVELVLVISTLIAIVIAYFFSLNIRKSIFGLEPKEIAMLLSEQKLIFQNLERGLVAMTPAGDVMLWNNKAKMLLNVPLEKEEGQLVEVSEKLYQLYKEVMDSHTNQMNVSFTLENQQKLMISLCQMFDANGKLIGVIGSMEDITLVRTLAEEITDYRTLVDALRAQNHEFMNKLQVISGLIQLENYDEVFEYIDGQSRMHKRINHLFTEHIRDAKLAALILSKYEKAVEQRVDFEIDDESLVEALPRGFSSDEACLIVANLIDNSMDAIKNSVRPRIYVMIQANEDFFECIIQNSGPPIRAERSQLFQKGYSSKGDHRGFGLYNVAKILEPHHGEIYWENKKEVTWYVRINHQDTSR